MSRTIDDIAKEIEEVAFNGEGADKLRALKMLREDRGGSAITLPEPAGDGEVVNRLARVMRGCGASLCHAAYSQAFPRAKTHVDDAPTLHSDMIPAEIMEKVKKVRSLKLLYRHYPEIKGPGFPAGYPRSRGPLEKQEWARRTAAKLELDRMQREAEGKRLDDEWKAKLKDAPIEVIPLAQPE